VRQFLKPRTIVIVLAVLLIMGGSAVLLRVPMPAIVLPPEPVACIGGHLVEGPHGVECEGGFPLTNSMLGTLLADISLLALVFFGLRNMMWLVRRMPPSSSHWL